MNCKQCQRLLLQSDEPHLPPAAVAAHLADCAACRDRLRLLGLIEANPSLFSAYDDEHRFAKLRRFPYSLVYQAQPAGIYVIAVAHSGRAAGYWEGRV